MPQKPEVFDLDMFDSHLIPTPQLFVTLFATITPLTTLFCFPTLKTAASGQADSLSHRVIGSTRSETHTSELHSLMRRSYAVFCLKKKKKQRHQQTINHK